MIMKLQRINSKEWNITLKPDYLKTLMCAAKYMLNGRKEKIPPEAHDRLMEMLNDYEAELRQIYQTDDKKVTSQ